MVSMGVNVYKYLVNPYSLQGIKNITEVPKGKDFSIICDCTTETFMVLYQMSQDHIALFTVPGHACLYDILNICGKDSKVDIELKSTCYEMSDTFVQELIEVRCVGDYYKQKITAKHNDDGSVTFSVPTAQVLRIKEDAVPVFVPHGDEPGERGEQGGVDDILVLTDKVDVLREGPLRDYAKEIELKCNDKFESFVEYWQSLPVPRKIIFRMEKDSQDVYKVESLYFALFRGFITAQYIGNMCNLNPLSIEDKVKDLRSRLGLDYKSPFEREKELISKLQPDMLTYTDVAADGSKDENVFTLCRCGRGNGKPIFDPSSPDHRSIIMSQALREMMMPIEDKFPQLHRARLNKPKSI